jgi:hypothetical protein
MHVLLELSDALCAKSMRDSLSLSRVFCSVSCVEQSAGNADKGVVILALQEPSAVAIDDGNGSWVCDGNVVRLDADEFAVDLVCFVYGEVSSASTALVHEPEVGECCWEGCGYIANGPVA